MPLRGRGALVTGGSRGIGRAIVRRLVTDGAAVAFTHHTHPDDAADLQAELAADGGHAGAVSLDVADPDRFPAAFATVDDVLGRFDVGLDIVVANAGVFTSAPLAETAIDAWDRVLAVNARGTLLTLQYAIPRLADNGRVITVSTIGTGWPSHGEATYAASKAAVEQLTRVASRELGGHGITANIVSAGPTDTDLLRTNAAPHAVDGAAAMAALGRLGRPTDIADVVALLARPESGW